MLIELDKFLDFVVNSGNSEINCGLLSILLREIVKKLDLSRHTIELNEEEFHALQQHDDIATTEAESNHDEDIPTLENQEFATLSTKDVSDLRRLSEEIVCVRNSEHSLNAFFDVVNIVKRIDALEIGIRLLGGALQDIRVPNSSEDDEVNLTDAASQRELDSTVLSSLNTKIDWLSDELRKFNCKCNSHDDVVESSKQEDDEAQAKNVTITKSKHNNIADDKSDDIPRNVKDSLLSLQSDVNDMRRSLKAAEDASNQFMKSVSKQLESFRSDLINCLNEIQSMMDCKVDKCHVQDLRTFVDNKITEATQIGERILRRAAAGTARALIADVNCVSCGDNAIQSDTTTVHFPPAPTSRKQPFSVGEIENRQQHSVKHPTRHCGGKH